MVFTMTRRARPRQPVASFLGICAASALIIGCGGNRPDPVVELSNTTMPPMLASVHEIARSFNSLQGRTVVTSGEVNRVFGPRWFSIGGGDFEGGGELLVVGPSTVPGILSNLADSGAVMNDIIQVRGVVRIFEEDAIERQIGVDLDGDVFDGFDGKPVLVMSELDITPRVDVTPVAAVPIPVPVMPIIDPLVVVDAPDRNALVGDIAALLGVEVQAVVSERAFFVGPSPAKQILVVTETPMREIAPGQVVAIAGTISALPANLATVRSEWGLSAAAEAMLASANVYLKATDVEVTRRP